MTSINLEALAKLSREAGRYLPKEDTRGLLGNASAFLNADVASLSLRAAQTIIVETAKMHRVAEEERTKRIQIEASKQVALARIEASRLLLEQYMTRAFDERRSTLDQLFTTLTEAQMRDDSEGMQTILSHIVDVVKSSPFKDLSEFKKHYNDPDFTLEM